MKGCPVNGYELLTAVLVIPGTAAAVLTAYISSTKKVTALAKGERLLFAIHMMQIAWFLF